MIQLIVIITQATVTACLGSAVATIGYGQGALYNFVKLVFDLLNMPGAARYIIIQDYCLLPAAERHRLDYLDLSCENILGFLNQIDVAYATRQSWKTHMLRLLDWLEESETRGEWYAKQRRRVLKFVKVKRMNAERGGRRSQRALSRAEVEMLRWDDIDLDVHTVTVRHGNGDKRRIAAIADVTDATMLALYALW